MPYIDKVYYDSEFKGTPISDQVAFDRLSSRASDLIDMVTNYVLHGVEFEQFAQLIQDNVKKATAAQVEYMFLQGGETSVHGGSPSSVRIGNFDYQDSGEGQQVISPIVISYLRPTGLLYRGVSVRDC
ncbi:hypothetical protein [Metabacillus bambusae]|uniref:Uncharacterized protein n=1 Tax=Metabacillus bambusae TaxID=2795218 RepID=A0ABS3NBF5_9BACI|nr:hypothetical protein [Metabacillus bambusae]MBO1515601.1 hypothetical protein [Metabacillus bambusae]